MCTVTYLPTGDEGYIITSTRDEKTFRKAALEPAHYHIHNQDLYYPRDEQAFGTWIAASLTGYTLCLLNGGFKVHTPEPPYRKSRGIVLLDFFQYNDVVKYRDEYDFSGIEPFTLLLINDLDTVHLDEIKWDGDMVHHRSHSPDDPRIWSSVTLYTDEIIRNREHWFKEWLESKPEFTQENIIQFHKTGGSGDIRNDILMNRDEQMLTVSITSVNRTASVSTIVYDDIVQSKKSRIRMR